MSLCPAARRQDIIFYTKHQPERGRDVLSPAKPEPYTAESLASSLRTHPAPRLYAIDWLRLIAVFAVFLFHIAHIFDLAGQANDITHDPAPSVRDSETSVALSVFAFFVYQWVMPVIFVLAGMTAWFSLRSRKGRRYVRERLSRLLVPFLFGSLILIPWNGYLSALNHRTFSGSYYSYLPVHFKRIWDALKIPQFHHGLSALYMTSWHLWFLAFLLLFSLLALPLFLRAGAEPHGRTQTYLADLCETPWGLAALGLPIMLTKLSLNAAFPSFLDWSDTLIFFLLFIYGWLFMTDPRFVRVLAGQAAAWFVVGCICYGIILGTYALGLLPQWLSHPSYSLGYSLYEILVSVDTWAWLLAIVGLGLRLLNFRTASLEYATEATLPFYILHQPIVLTIAFVVVQYQVGMVWKVATIGVTAFLTTILVYEFAVRRSVVLRTLFGMKRGHKASIFASISRIGVT